MRMRGDVGGCGCTWGMECEFPGESKRAKKRREWAEVDKRGGVCESGEWGGGAQVVFSLGGPGMLERLPCLPAVESVGSRLIPNSSAWRDSTWHRCPMVTVCFCKTPGMFLSSLRIGGWCLWLIIPCQAVSDPISKVYDKS